MISDIFISDSHFAIDVCKAMKLAFSIVVEGFV
jgi:hypothetical protein